MKILVTGAKGFVGKNLCAALQNVAKGKDRSRGIDSDIEIFQYDISSFIYLVEKMYYKKTSVDKTTQMEAIRHYKEIKRVIKEYKKDKKSTRSVKR